MGNIPKNRDREELFEEFTKHARKLKHQVRENGVSRGLPGWLARANLLPEEGKPLPTSPVLYPTPGLMLQQPDFELKPNGSDHKSLGLLKVLAAKVDPLLILVGHISAKF